MWKCALACLNVQRRTCGSAPSNTVLRVQWCLASNKMQRSARKNTQLLKKPDQFVILKNMCASFWGCCQKIHLSTPKEPRICSANKNIEGWLNVYGWKCGNNQIIRNQKPLFCSYSITLSGSKAVLILLWTMLTSHSQLAWILPHQITPESTWAQERYRFFFFFLLIQLNSLTSVKCLLWPGVLTHSTHTAIPVSSSAVAFIQFTMTELQTGP